MRTLIIIITLISICFQVELHAQYFDTIYQHPAEASILDGEAKSFLVTGYSTSHQPKDNAWPSILQNMLNKHVGNDHTYYVHSHTVGGTPIAKWLDICGTGQHITDTLNYYVNPGTKIFANVPSATIMLAQQSLQWGFGDCTDRFINIEGPGDSSRISQAKDVILQYVQEFLGGGIETVYMATHIYKTGRYPLGLCGEKYGLASALEAMNELKPGPELCEITKTMFPWGFAQDQVHPDTEVAHAMALYWYLVLAGEDVKIDIAQEVADIARIELPKRSFTTNVFDQIADLQLKIFPNPSKNILSVRIQSTLEDIFSIDLIDINGNSVIESIKGFQSTTINMNHLHKGIYFIQIEYSNIRRSYRVVKI